MDYGPIGNADVTENLTESVACGPVLHNPAEPEQDSQSLPYLHIKTPFQSLDSAALKQVCPLLLSVPYLLSLCAFFSLPIEQMKCM